MPISTNVTNLKINELTEAQYDSAVQGGVIGANELSILTDVDAGQVIQVATLPTASADELGNIYQFVGTTDANYTNGYFYKCTGAGDPVVYSWLRVDVQPSPSGGLQNTATGTDSLTILGTAATANDSTNIGVGSSDAGGGVSIGKNAVAGGYNGVCIGNGTKTHAAAFSPTAVGNGAEGNGSYVVAIGYQAKVGGGSYGIQLGKGTNNTPQTLCVGNQYGNFEIMSADGTIPHARLTNAVQSTTVTIATTDWSSNTASVTVSGLTATSVVWVAPDNASQSAYTTAGVYASSQSADTLTFTCTQTPTANLTVNIVWC